MGGEFRFGFISDSTSYDLSAEEAVTIVAALRAWAAMPGSPVERYEQVYGAEPEVGLVDDETVDKLCEYINTGEM